MTSATQDEFLAATLPALDLVYNLARRLVWDPTEVEDVVQETYLRAFDAWARRRRPRKVEPWMATICLNLGRTWIRRETARRELAEREQHTSAVEEDLEEEAMRDLRSSALHRALWELPAEQRIAITLMDLDGFTASESARITKAPRGTVLSRVHRGRKRLASILRKEGAVHEEA
ncbi:MAG: RNA polymerase sigma factor [Actinomycetota bacterium]